LSLPDKRTKRSFEDRMMLTLEVPHGQELELPSSGPPTKQNSAQHLQMHPQHEQEPPHNYARCPNPMYNNKNPVIFCTCKMGPMRQKKFLSVGENSGKNTVRRKKKSCQLIREGNQETIYRN
jgi:hypothetical protein